jgi:hypothetical protein
MKIEQGKTILCVRFSNVGQFDAINEHIKVLEENNYVWFGKSGSNQ